MNRRKINIHRPAAGESPLLVRRVSRCSESQLIGIHHSCAAARYPSLLWSEIAIPRRCFSARKSVSLAAASLLAASLLGNYHFSEPEREMMEQRSWTSSRGKEERFWPGNVEDLIFAGSRDLIFPTFESTESAGFSARNRRATARKRRVSARNRPLSARNRRLCS